MNGKRELTCIVCPAGCLLTVTTDTDGNMSAIEGNACKRGVGYAREECTRPMRTLTTTMALAGGGMLPVRTDGSVPRDLLDACMREINGQIIPPPVEFHAVLIENVAGTGANVVATDGVERQ